MHALPDEYQMRPGRLDDIPELIALESAYTTAHFGRSLRTEGELRTEWKTPHFDPARDSRVIIDPDGAICGWVEVYDFDPHVILPSRQRMAPTAPEAAATCLLAWSIERARRSVELAPPNTRVAFTQSAFDVDRAANQRLIDAGLSPVRVFLRMQIEMESIPEAPVWPDGITVRTFVKGQDDIPAVEAMREAFADHWGHVETPLEDDIADWKQWIYEDEDFDIDLWFLAEDAGKIVGFCQCYPVGGDDPRIGLVDELGVLRSHRGRGLATALLRHAFGAFFARDKTIVELGVDAQSLTGATRLYEKVGMQTVRQTNVYELELRPGEEISNRG